MRSNFLAHQIFFETIYLNYSSFFFFVFFSFEKLKIMAKMCITLDLILRSFLSVIYFDLLQLVANCMKEEKLPGKCWK